MDFISVFVGILVSDDDFDTSSESFERYTSFSLILQPRNDSCNFKHFILIRISSLHPHFILKMRSISALPYYELHLDLLLLLPEFQPIAPLLILISLRVAFCMFCWQINAVSLDTNWK